MRNLLNRLFLVRCFRQNKSLFFLVLLFIFFVAYGHRTGCEITPFYIFGMYTGKGQAKKDSLLLVKVWNDRPGDTGRVLNLYHTIDEPRRMMIFSTLDGYNRGARNGYEDPHLPAVQEIVRKHPFMRRLSGAASCPNADYAGYPAWLLRYLQGAVDKQITRAGIDIRYFHYGVDNLPIPDSSNILYEFQQNGSK